MTKQTTISKSVSLSGVGIHTGKKVKITFKPAPANHGYAFSRIDLEGNPIINADANLVVNTKRGTNLEKNGVSIQTSEHVLAALVGLEIDNVLIELNASEPPIMDGSSIYFVEALLKAGIEEQDEPMLGQGIDVINGDLCDMISSGIIDPVLVTKSALKNAVSVVTTIISADCVISNMRGDESSK